MKKFVRRLVILMCILSSIQMTAYADTAIDHKSSEIASEDFLNINDIESLLDEEMTTTKKEEMRIIDALEEEIDSESVDSQSLDEKDENVIQSYDINELKREVVVDSTMIRDYHRTKSFQELISEDSRLYVPIETVGGQQGYAVLSDDDQEMLGWCSNVDGTDGFYQSTDEIAAILNNFCSDSKEEIQEIKFVNAARYDSHLIYILTKSQREYAIPYFSESENYLFQNGQVYGMEEFIDQLDESVDEDSMLDSQTFGGIVFKDYNGIAVDQLGIILIGGMISLACCIYLYRKIIKNRQKI